ncbi:hypothetical protein [Pseudonocardia alaniniphila]|uniref:hypothetical protein n=1 Tax=Pseudonocardia alaniniphila TaxID=75291 RepID=UPI001F128FD1|nr:hypothetical protein [Pseudonocardia alaniniphila]
MKRRSFGSLSPDYGKADLSLSKVSFEECEAVSLVERVIDTGSGAAKSRDGDLERHHAASSPTSGAG